MGNFYTDVLQKHPRFRDTAPVGDLSLLDPETRRRVEALIADAAREGVTLMAFETYRSKERQQLLFKQKVTKLQNVGVHHYGLAADLVRSVGGHPSWKGDFSIVGRLARRHGLIWGGDWGRPGVKPSFVDPVHVQRCTVGRQKQLFAGAWYPDDAYDPCNEMAMAAPRALRRGAVKRRARGAVKRASKGAVKAAAKRSTKRAKALKRTTRSAASASKAKRGTTGVKRAARTGAAASTRANGKSARTGRVSAKRSVAKRSVAKRSAAKRPASTRTSSRRSGRRR